MPNDVDAPTPRLCRICRDMLPGYESGDVCDGCKLDSLVPRWFHRSEDERYDTVWGQVNAHRRPRTGVEVLDLPPPARCCDVQATEAELRRACEREAQMGLNDGQHSTPETVHRARGFCIARPHKHFQRFEPM